MSPPFHYIKMYTHPYIISAKYILIPTYEQNISLSILYTNKIYPHPYTTSIKSTYHTFSTPLTNIFNLSTIPSTSSTQDYSLSPYLIHYYFLTYSLQVSYSSHTNPFRTTFFCCIQLPYSSSTYPYPTTFSRLYTMPTHPRSKYYLLNYIIYIILIKYCKHTY